MIIHTAHKIQLMPNNVQRTFFGKCAAVSRFAWNHALGEWDLWYKNGMKPSGFKLKQSFNSYRKDLFPWTGEVHRDAYSQPFMNLNKAFSRFFAGVARYPKFKKKGGKDSFYLANDKFKLKGKFVRIPKIGWVKLAESFRFNGRILSATVSKVAGKWFIAINIEVSVPEPERKPISAVGIDLGLNTFAVLSNGDTYSSPKPYRRLMKRLRLLNKSVSRKVKWSRNWYKAVEKLSRLHMKIANIRRDFIHKVTSDLTAKYSVICIEDLNISGMARNKRLSKSIMDAGWSEFRRQLEYKCERAGINLIVVDRFFPSTKLCMDCGQLHKMPLNKRVFECSCGTGPVDRDLHAARNILRQGLPESA